MLPILWFGFQMVGTHPIANLVEFSYHRMIIMNTSSRQPDNATVDRTISLDSAAVLTGTSATLVLDYCRNGIVVSTTNSADGTVVFDQKAVGVLPSKGSPNRWDMQWYASYQKKSQLSWIDMAKLPLLRKLIRFNNIN